MMSIVVLCGLLTTVLGAHLPNQFQQCHIKDPTIDECLRKNIEKAIIASAKGIPSINLAPIDPLTITKIQIGAGSGAVDLVQYYDNVTTSGFSKQNVTDAHFDLDKKELIFTTHCDEVVQKGKYKVNGKILVIPVHGNGDSIIQLKDTTFIHRIIFKEETVKGKRYFKVSQYIVKISIKGAHYQFDNLFDGDKRLGDNINNVINENWDVIFEDIKSGVEKSYGEVLKQLAASVFNHIPADEIFLS